MIRKICRFILFRLPVSRMKHSNDIMDMAIIMKAQQEYIMITRNDIAAVANMIARDKVNKHDELKKGLTNINKNRNDVSYR